MRSGTDVQQLIQKHLPELGRKFAVAEIGIFGSYARGEQSPGSDLDLLVNFSEPVGLVAFIQLENYLQQLLGVKVDLVTPSALKPHIGERILKEVVYVH